MELARGSMAALEKLHGHAQRLGRVVEKHESTIGAIVTHGAYQAEAIVAGGLAALADHYGGTNGAPMQVMGIPVVGLAGLVVGGLSLAGGARPWAGHAANVAAVWEGIGTYNIVGSALANMKST